MKLNLRAKAEPEVNMTSLIDVVLLLLIFFMISTSFVKESKISITLPEADSEAIVEEVPEQLEIMITEQGTYLINGRELVNSKPETIRNALQRVSTGNTSLPLPSVPTRTRVTNMWLRRWTLPGGSVSPGSASRPSTILPKSDPE